MKILIQRIIMFEIKNAMNSLNNRLDANEERLLSGK